MLTLYTSENGDSKPQLRAGQRQRLDPFGAVKDSLTVGTGRKYEPTTEQSSAVQQYRPGPSAVAPA